jgi:segregation and condensation protein A
MQIKVKMLLPREETDGEAEDPRTELVRQLLQYKRFKEAAEEMSDLEDARRKLFFRTNFSADEFEKIVEVDDGLKNVTLFHLIAAFKYAMEHIPKQTYHTVERLNVTIDEQVEYIQHYFSSRRTGTFLELIAPMKEKIRIVVTVLALLEMVKLQQIIFRMAEHTHDILIESHDMPILPHQLN